MRARRIRARERNSFRSHQRRFLRGSSHTSLALFAFWGRDCNSNHVRSMCSLFRFVAASVISYFASGSVLEGTTSSSGLASAPIYTLSIAAPAALRARPRWAQRRFPIDTTHP